MSKQSFRTTSVRLSQDEFEELHAIAAWFGLPLATYIRTAALNPAALAEIPAMDRSVGPGA